MADGSASASTGAQTLNQAPGRAATGIRGLFAKLKKAPPWVWIAILVAAVGVVIAYMSYRKQQALAAGTASGATDTSAGSVPGGGSGQPNWPAGDMSGFATSNDAVWQALLDYLMQMKPPVPTPAPSPNPGPVPGYQPPIQSGGYGLGPVPGKIMQIQPWQQGRFAGRGFGFGGFGSGTSGAPAQRSGPGAPATGGVVPPGTGFRNLIRKPPVRF